MEKSKKRAGHAVVVEHKEEGTDVMEEQEKGSKEEQELKDGEDGCGKE